MRFRLDPGEPFMEEVMAGISSCMTDVESRFACDGPLSEILLRFGRDGAY